MDAKEKMKKKKVLAQCSQHVPERQEALASPSSTYNPHTTSCGRSAPSLHKLLLKILLLI